MDIRLENVLKYEQPTKYIVKSENYSDDFALPVLTAGKSFVLGYTDETEGVCKASENPVIIFDDFTADCKYVDFDFKVKSSAMKILHKVNAEDNLKYYFYAMQAIDYTPFSHKRVWISEYSKFKIENRSFAEQNNIVKDLDTVATAIDNAKQRLNTLDELVKSRFIEMFGDPEINEKIWTKTTMGNYITTLTDFNANGSYAYLDSNVTMYDDPHYALMVRTTDLERNDFQNGVKYIDENAYQILSKSKVFGGEIIMNKIGSAGKIYLMPHLDRPVSLGRNAFLFRYNENINTLFLYYQLSTEYGTAEILQHVKGATTKTITKDAAKSIKIIVPPIELQNEFADFVKLIDKSKFIVQKQIEDLQELLDSKMDEYFG